MATQALYRQWRPNAFADVVGQDAVVTTLKNQIASGRVAHAYLFCGSRGTGKTTCAKIFARAVNCLSPRDGDPCGQCEACLALAAENCLDIVEIDATSNNGVDEIRDLREKIKYPPQYGRYRVYIVDEVHMLSAGAFNALLKTLEEPPAHALFLLATTEPQRLPATVLSRCQRYDFHRIPARVIVGRLKTVVEGERAQATDGALARIATAAEGGMRDALSLLDMCLSYGGGSVDEALVGEVLGASDRTFLFAFAEHLLGGDAGGAMRDIDEMMRAGREPQVFARDVTRHLRALLLSQTCAEQLEDLLEITGEDAARYAEQGKRVSRERLLYMLDLFLASETDMKWAGLPRIALETAAVRACLPDAAPRLDALCARLDQLERRMAEEAPPAPKPAGEAPAPRAASARQPVRRDAPAPRAALAEGGALWEQVMRQVKKDIGLYAQVRMGTFAGIDGEQARLVFAKGNEIFLNVLRQAGRKEKLEAMLSEAAGRPMALSLEMESPAQGGQNAGQANMQAIFDAFGRENVQVVDD